ncbi:efflux transporter outer membrane subunit [Burkholderia gladioli]|uniref:efflux transporter outer membrane subunit n=1 Tax=Burkholderia gladioli TaxID=28095 RepID=UPI002FD7F901
MRRAVFAAHASRRVLAATVAAAMGLAGCGDLVKTRFQRPALELPAGWRGTYATTGQQVADGGAWWKRFGDPQLDALIERALRTNNDLAAAGIRLYSARLQAGLTNTNLTPNVSVSAGPSYSRNLTRGGATTRSTSINLQASYELDLWGRLARVRDAAAWEAEASEYDRRATALALINTVASLYWQIANLNATAATTKESIATAQRTLTLIHVQHEAGEVSEFEESQVRSELDSLLGNMTQIQQQLESSRNALAIVFNQPPSHREPELDALPIRPLPALPDVMPAQLLSRRPDLQAAQTRLKETLAQADAQRLAFYPTFSLTGSVVSGDLSIADILRNPIGTIAGSLALPFIQFNTADLTIRSSKATYDLAVVNFRKSLYQALADAETAIASCRESAIEVSARQRSLKAARTAETLAEVRYRAGSTSLTDWLSLQQSRQTTELQLQQAILNQYVNMLTLYVAIGGDPQGQDVAAES